MAHAAANLTYIIHEASESEQQHMFPHDACGLEVQQRCDSTPLRSDGNFFPPLSRTRNGFQSRAQGASCLLVAWGQQRSFIRISLRTHHLKWVARKSYKHQSVMLAELGSLTVEDVLCVIGPDPVIRVMTNRGRSQGRVAGHDVKAAF